MLRICLLQIFARPKKCTSQGLGVLNIKQFECSVHILRGPCLSSLAVQPVTASPAYDALSGIIAAGSQLLSAV